MPDTRQFALLSDLAQERRDAAARKLARALKLLTESKARLELLEKYASDYRVRLALNVSHGVTADELRNFREFIAKLGEAIGQQRAEVETLARGVTDCRNGWMFARREGLSFDVLAERAEASAREVESRRLQKLVDEFAGRVAALRVVG